MSQRAEQLETTAVAQIGELINLVSTADDAMLRRQCPGRAKLGDGTIGAIAAHTADNYQRIGSFVVGQTPPDESRHQANTHSHKDGYTAETARPEAITQRLTAARQDLARIAQLTDQQLDAVPPKDSFRFCDGQRMLEQVLAGLFKHQDHQLQTIKAALHEPRASR